MRPQSTAAPFSSPLLWAMAASWPLAYLYTKEIFFCHGFAGWAMLVFALAFLAWVDLTARALHRPAAKEAPQCHPQRRRIAEAEDHPAEIYNDEQENVAQHRRYLLQLLPQHHLVTLFRRGAGQNLCRKGRKIGILII